MTKIDIISGFLGAGKTTLIKKLIKEAFVGEKLVLIENEFGEIGIDGGFLKEGGIEITEMNSGCICCSLVGDFGVALKNVMTQYAPDRIIIEPSGVGKLSDVIKAVQNVHQEAKVKINCKTAVVDAVKCKMYMKNFGEFFNNQIENASCIILSRTQKISEEKLKECVAKIKEHNKEAALITTPWEDIDGKKILEAMELPDALAIQLMQEICEEHHHHECCEDDEHHHHHECCEDGEHHHHHGCCEDDEHHHHECCEDGEHHHHHECGEGEEHHHHHECCEGGEHHHHHHADEIFTSWGIQTTKRFSRVELEKILEKLTDTELYGSILRAKGILQNTDETWLCFDMVPGEYEVREESADYTGRLCVIGTKLDEQALETLFIES